MGKGLANSDKWLEECEEVPKHMTAKTGPFMDAFSSPPTLQKCCF